MLLTVALTEELADDATVVRTDSCAKPDNAMINEIWRERLALCDRLIALRPRAPFAFACRFEALRNAAIAGVKAMCGRLFGAR